MINCSFRHLVISDKKVIVTSLSALTSTSLTFFSITESVCKQNMLILPHTYLSIPLISDSIIILAAPCLSSSAC